MSNLLFSSKKGKILYLDQLSKNDVTTNYLSWFKDPEIIKYIQSANKMKTLKNLEDFVESKIKSKSCLFFGIYENQERSLVGTVKLEPVDFVKGNAELGILIGNTKYRNCGIGCEAIRICSQYVNRNYNINCFTLGVSKENIKALVAYQKCGFAIINKKDNSYRMKLDIG